MIVIGHLEGIAHRIKRCQLSEQFPEHRVALEWGDVRRIYHRGKNPAEPIERTQSEYCFELCRLDFFNRKSAGPEPIYQFFAARFHLSRQITNQLIKYCRAP